MFDRLALSQKFSTNPAVSRRDWTTGPNSRPQFILPTDSQNLFATSPDPDSSSGTSSPETSRVWTLARSSTIRIFNAGYYTCLKRVPFLDQLVNTLGIGAFDIGQALQIS